MTTDWPAFFWGEKKPVVKHFGPRREGHGRPITADAFCHWCDSGFSTGIAGWCRDQRGFFCSDWCQVQSSVSAARGESDSLSERLTAGFEVVSEDDLDDFHTPEHLGHNSCPHPKCGLPGSR